MAEGRVHWSMQVHVAQPKADPLRVDRVKSALTYLLRESGTLEIGDSAADAWAQIILSAIDAPPKANTCAPSTEGLLDKGGEDHG